MGKFLKTKTFKIGLLLSEFFSAQFCGTALKSLLVQASFLPIYMSFYSEEMTVRDMECADSNDSNDSHTVSKTSNHNIQNCNSRPNQNETYKAHDFSDNDERTVTRANAALIQCTSGPDDPVQSLLKNRQLV